MMTVQFLQHGKDHPYLSAPEIPLASHPSEEEEDDGHTRRSNRISRAAAAQDSHFTRTHIPMAKSITSIGGDGGWMDGGWRWYPSYRSGGDDDDDSSAFPPGHLRSIECRTSQPMGHPISLSLSANLIPKFHHTFLSVEWVVGWPVVVGCHMCMR